jgi:hemoglobin/transferrin/lactoferrin receptor protein
MGRKALFITTAIVALAGTSAQAQDLQPELGFTLDDILLGSAFRDERAILDTPVAASIREGEALANRQADDFAELIGDIPGVTIDGGPRGISQEPNIRGFRDEQMVLRFDGGRFNFGQAHRGRFFVDPALVQRVEVVRGGGSTLFGSGALGGVISVETVDAADLLEPGQTQGGRLTFGFGSNGSQPSASSTLYADYGTVDLLFSLAGRSVTDDLEAGGGTLVPFSQIDTANALFKLGVEPNADSRLEFSYSIYQDDTLVPANSSGSPSGSNPVVDRDADVQDLRLSWDYAPESSDLIDLSILFYGTRLEIVEDVIPPGTPRRDETRYDTYGLEIVNRSTFDLGVPVDLVYGIEALRDTQEGTRDGAPRLAFPDAEATTLGVFAEATIGLSESLDLIAGARFDSYERNPDDPALAPVSEEFFSPRIGLSYRPNDDWQIFGNVARAYRAPTLSELYNSGLHFAGNPFGFPPNNFFVPNPNLRPESSTQLEIGTRFERGDVFRGGDTLRFGVNAYYATVDDYIEQTVNIAAGTTTSANVASATLWGFEAEANYDAEDWFVGAGLSIARGQNDAGGWLGSIPQDRLTLSGGVRPWDDWELGARATFAADQTQVPAAGSPSDGYQLLDLYATWTPEGGPLGNATVRFGIDNVFDEAYTIYPNGLPQPGRSLEISATFTF